MRHRSRLTSGALLALLLLPAPVLRADENPNPLPTLTVNGSSAPVTVPRGARITVAVDNAPGTPGEWVALYPLDPPNATYITWKYLNGTQGEAAPPGQRSALLTFDLPFTPGDFELRLLPFVGLAQIAVARVSIGSAELPITINGTLSEIEVKTGATVAVSVQGPGNALDWIGLHDVRGTDHQHPSWKYLNGSTDPPGAGVRQATVAFQMPTTPGVYNFRFFLNDKYTRIAKSAMVLVVPADKLGTIDGSDQPDSIPDLIAYQRLFENLRWKNEFGGAGESLGNGGLDETQVELVLNALESYVQGTSVASLMVSLQTALGADGWTALQAYTREQVKPAIKIIPGEN
jgi:hypothetical protein